LLNALEYIYQQQRDFIAQLPEAERAVVGTPDRWSAKDMLAHTAFWTNHRLANFEAKARGEATTVYEDYERQNQVIFARYRDTPWDEVERMLEATHTRAVGHVQATTEVDLFGVERSPVENVPVWRVLVGTRMLHVLFHLIDYHIAHGRQAQAREMSDRLYELGLTLDDSPEWHGVLLYDRACVDALTGQPETAVERLGQALRLHPGLVEWSKQDSDLDSLRERADYQALYE